MAGPGLKTPRDMLTARIMFINRSRHQKRQKHHKYISVERSDVAFAHLTNAELLCAAE